MESFVDRETALKYIDDAFETLQDKKRLLRTPIIDFYGVGGIGKTFLLKKVQQQCRDERLRCIWVDANQSISNLSREVVRQVQQYSVVPPVESNSTNALYNSISAARVLLKQGPVVMLFDAIDTSNKEQLNWLEMLLRDLSDDNNLLAVLTSKRALSFEHNRSLARKLTLFPLEPFDRLGCEAYLNAVSNQIEPEIRDRIFVWTRGYPLALNVMAQAVESGLDPRKGEDQKEIITRLTDQVLNQSVFVRVDPEERDWYETILPLLSVPRHFNLIVMQDLIEKFIPELARENSLAYFGLPREINQKTEVVHWDDIAGTGFSVDTPARTIFLLKLQIEQPERYYAVHRFLAQMNKQLATGVSGTDRIRYLREYLYHSASSEDATMLPQLFASLVQEIVEESPESLQLFADEVSHDEELREMLGEQVRVMESHLHKGLVQVYKKLAVQSSGVERISNLRKAFDHIMSDPDANDLRSLLKQTIEQIMQQEQPEITYKLYQELSQDDRFKTALGEDFESLSLLIRTDYLSEG
jgi:AAA ATPase domain